MLKFLSSVGLGGLTGKKIKFNRMLKDALAYADYGFQRKADKAGHVRTESYKNWGDGFGVVVYGESYNSKNRKGEKTHRMDINHWSLFARSENPIEISDFYVDSDDDGFLYAFCEEKNTGNLFEFKMNNLLEYEKRSEKGESVTGVNVAMLALFGTVILPVYKDEFTHEYRNEENRLQRELLERARSGDSAAEEVLSRKVSKMAQTVWERMKSEDILSIFEGYFLLIGGHNAHFSILADIERVEHLENNLTNEKVVKLLINITGTKLNLFINEKDLVGMPMAGMRFMGIGAMQGSAVFG